METISTLDVTVLEPGLRHSKIFEKFEGLTPGQSLIILNDHDPKPLYYQMVTEKGRTFLWDYLASGPKLWKVKITRIEYQGHEPTIGEIVTLDYRKAQVFKKFGIDFCCGGKKTVNDVCEKKGIDKKQLEQELQLLNDESLSSENDYLKWDIGFLSDFIINTHHRYIKDNAAFIAELANKVAKVHGDMHPEAIKIAEIFTMVAEDLRLHLVKEEKVLFPFIKELANIQNSGGKLPESSFGNVSNPIQIMEAEHEQAGESLETIRELTNNFTLPSDACNSYAVLYKKLNEFENDLHRHVHLENNVLFPKAIAVEKNFFYS